MELINAIDISIIHAIQALGSGWYDTAWLLSSIIGSTTLLAPIVIVVLLIIGKKRTALEIFIIFAVSAIFLVGMKHFIDAPRPYQVDTSVVPYATETDSGMPSGHAFISIIIFGWLWLRHPKSKVLSWGAGALVVLIGLSRIYLGVHYPSQVVVGWVLGVLFLWLFWWLDKAYFRPRSSYITRGL